MTNLVTQEKSEECWLEGIGNIPVPFHHAIWDTSEECTPYLWSCVAMDEVLGMNIYQWTDFMLGNSAEPSDPISIITGITVDTGGGSSHSGKVKQKIDFTHVIKKQPQREGETVVGNFTGNRLFVNVGKLYDLYTVVITDLSGQVVYTKQVQTDNVLALNIDISDYAYSDYTITVENDEHIFTGSFFCSPPYDYDGDGVVTVNDIAVIIRMFLDGMAGIGDITETIDAYLK